ncbi:hypothetical protein XENORESO_019301 [Xenotaenia resolanae]|uniref:Uncharacterized protein n=1 Tax=Xenotaenia resolanae TaxID=208358 RepID=A0ABV0VRL2_9TELE
MCNNFKHQDQSKLHRLTQTFIHMCGRGQRGETSGWDDNLPLKRWKTLICALFTASRTYPTSTAVLSKLKSIKIPHFVSVIEIIFIKHPNLNRMKLSLALQTAKRWKSVIFLFKSVPLSLERFS